MQIQLDYIAECIARKSDQAAVYRPLAENPISVTELGQAVPNQIQSDAAVISRDVMSLMNKCKYILSAPQRADMRNVSALHGMTSFLDIGDDALFDSIVNSSNSK